MAEFKCPDCQASKPCGACTEPLPDEILRDCVTIEDGYMVFWPTENHGYLAPHQLRMIADHLDKVNAPWDAIVQNSFEINPITKDSK